MGEPIFILRSASAAEGDGWLLTVIYLAAEHRSALIILDAADPDAPVAVVKVDRHFWPGFHGSVTYRMAAPASR